MLWHSGYLNVKCSLKAQLIEHLVPRQQSCLEELWKFQEMGPCWKKGVTNWSYIPWLHPVSFWFSNCEYCDLQACLPCVDELYPTNGEQKQTVTPLCCSDQIFYQSNKKRNQLWVILESMPKDFMLLLFLFVLFCGLRHFRVARPFQFYYVVVQVLNSWTYSSTLQMPEYQTWSY